jgi:transposase-like protein
MKKTTYSDNQKAKIVLEAIRGEKTINQISSHYQVHPNQVHCWKTTILENLPGLFSKDNKKDKILSEKEKLIEELYKIIGQRETELNWLKKKLSITDN